MFKKVLAFILAFLLCVGMVACSKENTDDDDKTTSKKECNHSYNDATCEEPKTCKKCGKETGKALGHDFVEGVCSRCDTHENPVKVGFIFLHDEYSAYDKNFVDAAKQVCEEMNVDAVYKTNIPEGNACYEAAADLVNQGCDIVFANAFGHEDFMLKAAKEFPDVQFCHATGYKANSAGVKNYHNAYAAIHEGRYASGVVAGMKLNEMIAAGKITAEQAKMGYVGAFTYAEVISAYTAFYLGAKSVCPSVTMDVKFTGSWCDETKERQSAQALIAGGCVLISQHADSMGAPTACEITGVPNVAYNSSTTDACPNTYLVATGINWVPYFKYMINQVLTSEEIASDWAGTMNSDSVILYDLGRRIAPGTKEKLDEVVKGLKEGTINVFDTKNFTVRGETLTSYKADVYPDAYYAGDTEVIDANGIFQESQYRSAPYFDLWIDGITLLDTAY